MMRSIKVALAAMLAFFPLAAHADCLPRFASGDQSVTVVLGDIAPGRVFEEQIGLRVVNGADDPGGPCNATIRVFHEAGPPEPGFPDYTLSAPGNDDVRILEPGTQSGGDGDVVIANLPPGANGRAVPFRLRLPAEWGLASGEYVERLTFTLFGPDGQPAASTVVTIRIVVPGSVSLRLVGAIESGSGRARVDLGVLTPAVETRSPPFAARVFSTGPYTLRFTSQNLGNLRAEAGSHEIAYRLYFDGALVNLAGPSVYAYPVRTNAIGDLRPLSVVVPPFDPAPPGRYADTVTIVISAS